ncbi:MAG: MBL fold metallo-hydrolase [Bacillota bacterium]
MLGSNCYILGDSGEAAVIDAGVYFREISQILASEGLILKYIILTHAHIDHVMYAEKLRDACGGKVVIHMDDAPLLGNEALNGAFLFGLKKAFGQADLCVVDGDVLELGGLKLEIIHTAGHTPGSMCILVRDGQAGSNARDAGEKADGTGNFIFTGDTLFRLGIGRTDLGAGDHERLMASLRKLVELGDDTRVYPGHGPATDIGYEKRHSQWL